MGFLSDFDPQRMIRLIRRIDPIKRLMPALTLNNIVQAASALHATGQHAQAAEYWSAALEGAPDDPVILTGAAVTHRALRQPDRAEELIRRAIALAPTPRRSVILACAIHDQLRFAEAEEAIRRARDADANYADAAGLLGIWLLERWHWRDTSDEVLAEALCALDRAIALAPDNVEFHTTRLAALLAADRLEDVILDATALCERWPSCGELHVQRAVARMKLGKLAQGHREFGDWAYRLPRLAGHPFHDYPQWKRTGIASDSDLPQTEVHVWNVEGAGDYFQFIRYARRMAEEGWTVRCITNRTMDRLISRAPGVAGVITEDADIPESAIMAPLVRLPAEYVRIEPFWRGPYLSADEATVSKWRRHLARLGTPESMARGFKVGVAWRGNPNQANDERRSFDFERLAPILDSAPPGVVFISLQHHPFGEIRNNPKCEIRNEEGAALARFSDFGFESSDFPRSGLDLSASGRWPVVDLGDEYQCGDWLDTAGVIANLDLVIAPCTGIAHLAGAMGKPVWLALSEPGCWRWGMNRKDEGGRLKDEGGRLKVAPENASAGSGLFHPSSFIIRPSERSDWYPSMRIFRQRQRGSWDGVFEAMACTLADWLREAA